MSNVKAVQMTISLVGMVICRQSHTMIDQDTTVANGIMRREETIVGRKTFERRVISITANNRADEAEPVATSNVLNVMLWVRIVKVTHRWRIIIQDDDQKLKIPIIKQIQVSG